MLLPALEVRPKAETCTERSGLVPRPHPKNGRGLHLVDGIFQFQNIKDGNLGALLLQRKMASKNSGSGRNGISLLLDYRADAKRKFVRIVRSYRMSGSKFGSLTINNARLNPIVRFENALPSLGSQLHLRSLTPRSSPL